MLTLQQKVPQSICASPKVSDNPPTSSQASGQVESTQSPSKGIFTTKNTTSVSKQQPAVLLHTAKAIASSSPEFKCHSPCSIQQ